MNQSANQFDHPRLSNDKHVVLRPPGWLIRLVSAGLIVGVVILGIVLSALLLAILALLALVGPIYLWWLRCRIGVHKPAPDGRIIEGEFVEIQSDRKTSPKNQGDSA